MSEFWEKVKTEIDRAGKVAQEALDEGKLRIELFRVRQSADKVAESIGYAVYRARKEGREPDQQSFSQLMSRLAESDAEISRIEAALRSINADPESPSGASESAPPPPAP